SSVDAAKEMILGLHPNRTLYVDFQDLNKRFIKGEHFRKFVMIFLILMDNAVVHSENEELVNICICAEKNYNYLNLKVINKVNPNDLRVSLDNIEFINTKINLTYIDDANKESGSGLFKIKKVITNDIKSENNIQIDLNGQEFSVVIRMDEREVLDEKY
ncbi:hypothetical protein, partial [Shewanella sp. 1180_01]|uniref:hypothetical protein n=1 Tax=Shewanella sp. 1180_01 TaxID=2604451 RepID=UPI004063A090